MTDRILSEKKINHAVQQKKINKLKKNQDTKL